MFGYICYCDKELYIPQINFYKIEAKVKSGEYILQIKDMPKAKYGNLS
jgi:hypothetical protein